MLTDSIWKNPWKSYITFEPHAFLLLSVFLLRLLIFLAVNNISSVWNIKFVRQYQNIGNRLYIEWYSNTFYFFGYQEYARFKLDFDKIYVNSSQAIHFIEKSCFWLCVGSSDHAVRRWSFMSLKTSVCFEQNFDRQNEYKIEPTNSPA